MKTPLSQSGSVLPLILVVSLAAFILVALLLLDRQPSVVHPGELGSESLRRIEQLIVDNSPERINRNGQQRIELSTAELNLLATFLLQRLPPGRLIAMEIHPRNPVSRVDLAVPLPLDSLSVYINLNAGVRMVDGSPELVSLQAGRIPVPGPLRELLLDTALRLLEQEELREAVLTEMQQTVRDVQILEDGVAVSLQWRYGTLTRLRNQARQALLGDEAQQRLLFYYRMALEADAGSATTGALHEWLSALFTSARDRTAQGADPVEENRSLLQALALHANDIDPRLLITDVPRSLRNREARLPPIQQRQDLSRHLLTAAAISASAGAPVADLLSNSKELHDARYGTGFSRSDMMANQAGARLGEMAVVDRQTARVIQQRLSRADDDQFFMPVIDADDTALDEETFQQQFTANDSEEFQQFMERLRATVDALPLYRSL